MFRPYPLVPTLDVEMRPWELRSSSMYVTIVSAAIYAGYKVITNVVSLYIIESGVMHSKVVRGMESARGFWSTEFMSVRHLWRIVSYVLSAVHATTHAHVIVRRR